MRKLIKLFMSLSVMICLMTPVFAKTENSQSREKDINLYEAKATLLNKDTGVVSEVNPRISQIKVQNMSMLSDEVLYEVTYEVSIDVDNKGEIALLNSEDFGYEEAGVTAYATVGYTFKNSNSLLKISYIKGGWTPSNSLYAVSNRSVKLYQYIVTGKSLSKKPGSNSFNYETGWDYVTYVQKPYGASFYTQATIKVQGMSGTSYDLKLQSQFPN